MSPVRNPPAVEPMWESERVRVARVHLQGRTVISKEPLGGDAERRLRHEIAMLERLRGVEGVAQLVDTPPAELGSTIVLTDAGEANLDAIAKPLEPDPLIRFAAALARAIAGMHRRGVMHRDICPANIVISGEGAPCLVDFALATSMAELRPEFMPQSQIVGTLAYLAPEQTGRTGWPVDQRADLYALGATLYELATGEPPFGSVDPLRLTHDHLARVPVAPAQVNRSVPEPFSTIIMHLLEKEPDDRYQTAEGLVHDLGRLLAAGRLSEGDAWRVGERDVPLRLTPPSRLVGREREIAALREAFEEAREGRCSGVLVGGAPGVGKTAVVDELRRLATAREGWFVAGKFDQYRRDLEFDAVNQATRALGRLMLAEDEDEAGELRRRILAAAGQNAGLVAALVPEFATLLGVARATGDPLTAQVRLPRVGLEVLRAIASPTRPIVMFLDDLQWAGRAPLGFVDTVLGEDPCPGLLLVAAYRDEGVDAAHPLAAPLTRWSAETAVRQLWLENLSERDIATMVAEMLRVEAGAAERLAETIAPHSHGNPYETVELVNALYRAGALGAGPDGFRIDDAAVRRRLGGTDVAELLAARFESLAEPSRALIETMATLGGRAELTVLQTALDEPADALEQLLAPVLEVGGLVLEPGVRQALRFRHDRLREALLRQMEPDRRQRLHLAIARRLAEAPEYVAIAAEQYLSVVDAIETDGERERVVRLLLRAANEAQSVTDHAGVDALLAGALRLLDAEATETAATIHVARHAALFSLGRLEEGNEEYRLIESLRPSVAERADATAVQVRSLSHQNRISDAYALGTESLDALGISLPPDDRLAVELERHFDHLYRWLRESGLAADLGRGEILDPRLLAAATLINAVDPIAYFAQGPMATSWIGLEAVRIWHEHAPSRRLLGPAIYAGFAALALRGDFHAAYETARRILAVGEARGYEPETSEARYLASIVMPWFEPLERGVAAMQRAREGLIAGGELTLAAFTYLIRLPPLFDSARSLASTVGEVDAGLDFARRTGNFQSRDWLDSWGRLAGVLRGQSSAETDESALADAAANPGKLVVQLLTRSIAAAILGDPAALAQHTAAAVPLAATEPGYAQAQLRVLRGLALAAQAGAADGQGREDHLAELDDVMRWLAARATDAPDNFRHLLRLLEAERAWAVGDFRAAHLAFDAARGEVARVQRPWHQALITERAARFHLARGLEVAGHELLAEARREYEVWGATAKVDQLDWAYAKLEVPTDEDAKGAGHDRLERHPTLTTGTVDLLGVLSASQALSSETSVTRLHARVTQLLGALTGATNVQLVMLRDDGQDWQLPSADRGDHSDRRGLGRMAPMAVLRYVQRTRETLVVADVLSDERFARDPYFRGFERCSLLALPIVSRGALRAVLLLENRLMRGVFTAARLEAVRLIAAQLAVSLDNAELYGELAASRARIVAAADQARRRIERDVHDGAQQRLVTLRLRLRGVQASVPAELDELRAEIDRAADEAAEAIQELREIARGLHPAVLTEGGLRPALGALARRSAIPIELEIDVHGRLPEQTEITAYYVVAEALTNAAKHAHASAITVAVEASGELLGISVCDNGTGGASFARGSGLVGLRDRVEAFGGTLLVVSPPGGGTRLHVDLPLTAGAAAQSSR